MSNAKCVLSEIFSRSADFVNSVFLARLRLCPPSAGPRAWSRLELLSTPVESIECEFLVVLQIRHTSADSTGFFAFGTAEAWPLGGVDSARRCIRWPAQEVSVGSGIGGI
jgi:hypothetical protein